MEKETASVNTLEALGECMDPVAPLVYVCVEKLREDLWGQGQGKWRMERKVEVGGGRLPKLRLESQGGQLKGCKRCRDATVGISTN